MANIRELNFECLAVIVLTLLKTCGCVIESLFDLYIVFQNIVNNTVSLQ